MQGWPKADRRRDRARWRGCGARMAESKAGDAGRGQSTLFLLGSVAAKIDFNNPYSRMAPLLEKFLDNFYPL